MSAAAYALTQLRQNLPRRTIIAIVSVAFWIVATLVQTGSGGVIAIWTGALFMLELIVLSSATRTISIGAMATIFCAGGCMFGLAVLGGDSLRLLVPDRCALLRQFGVTILEESLKLLPVLYYLWRGRKKDTWAMGMPDVIL